MAKSGTRNSRGEKNRHLGLRLILIIIIAVGLGLSLIWEDKINLALGFVDTETNFDGVAVPAGDENLNVHFVDVGQGDARVIEFPDEKKMLIDAGPDKNKKQLLDYIDKVIDPDDEMLAKKESGGFGFDYALLTHSDEDHSGGFDDVLSLYGAEVLYRPNENAVGTEKNPYTDPASKADALNPLLDGYRNKNTAAYARAIDEGYKNSSFQYVTTAVDDSLTIKPDGVDESSPLYYELIFYGPVANDYTDANDFSPIMVLEYQGKRFMLSGDAEKHAEAEFVELATKKEGKYSVFTDSYTVDVFKLGHHGSRTSSSQEMINIMTTAAHAPNILAIVSCGVGNSYKHPHPEPLARLKARGFKDENILRTDVIGSIQVLVEYSAEEAKWILKSGSIVMSEIPDAPTAWRWRTLALVVMGAAIVIILVPGFVDVKKGSGRGGKKR